MDKDKALQYNERRGEVEHARVREGKIIGGKFSGTKSKRTARKLEREKILSDPKLIADKIAEIKAGSSPNDIPSWLKGASNEETHAMDKPKPLEEVSDGDLSEVKKDPVWKTWLEKKTDECPNCGKKRKGKKRKLLWNFITQPPDIYPSEIDREEDEVEKAWEVWLDNVTKPIPDSKGGKGSFQHCIDTNQDKHNPGGWCKQIERKIGKAKKVPNKEVKLPQTKIDEPKHHWDHSKVGRNTGWEDNPMNKPSYFQARMEEERQKKAKKKAGEDKTDDVVSTVKRRKRLQDYFEENEKKKIAEKPESDYYMDAGGNPQRKEKADYFVEEIRSNIIYHNKILPIIGMIASQAARGMGKMGKKVGSEVLEGVSEVGQGMLQGVGDEEEEQ